MAITLNMAPWEPLYPLWALSYDRYRAGLFWSDFGHSPIPGHSGPEEVATSTEKSLHGLCHSSAQKKASNDPKVPY